MWFYQCPACFDLLRRHSSLSRPMFCFSLIFHVFLQNLPFFLLDLFYSLAHDCTQNISPVVAPVTAFLFHTPRPLLFGWMISPPAGHPALARRPVKPREGYQDSGWRLFLLSQSALPPSSHQSECTDIFILHPPHFCSCSSVLPSFQPST